MLTQPVKFEPSGKTVLAEVWRLPGAQVYYHSIESWGTPDTGQFANYRFATIESGIIGTGQKVPYYFDFPPLPANRYFIRWINTTDNTSFDESVYWNGQRLIDVEDLYEQLTGVIETTNTIQSSVSPLLELIDHLFMFDMENFSTDLGNYGSDLFELTYGSPAPTRNDKDSTGSLLLSAGDAYAEGGGVLNLGQDGGGFKFLTFGLWLSFESLGTTQTLFSQTAALNDASLGYSSAVKWDAGLEDMVYLYTTEDSEETVTVPLLMGGLISEGEWHHFAIRCTGETADFLLDGEIVKSLGSVPMYYTEQYNTIGGYVDFDEEVQENWLGRLARLFVARKSFSVEQIQPFVLVGHNAPIQHYARAVSLPLGGSGGSTEDVTVSTNSILQIAEYTREAIDNDSTQLADIKAKTQNLPASPAAVGSAMTLANNAITAAVIATDAIDADSLKSDAVAKIVAAILLAPLGEDEWDTRTVQDALQGAWSNGLGKVELDLSNSKLRLYAPDNTTVLREFNLNSTTAPTLRTPA